MKDILKIVGKVISGVLFLILMLVIAFLLYYYISIRIYAMKGPGHEPIISIYTVMTGSMSPHINKMDIVVNSKIKSANDIKVGDVITFVSSNLQMPNVIVTHRVNAILKDDNGEVCYETKGDANQVADQACAKFHNVIGKVMFKIPKVGYVQKFLKTTKGWLLCVIIPALLVIINNLIKIIKTKLNVNKE